MPISLKNFTAAVAAGMALTLPAADAQPSAAVLDSKKLEAIWTQQLPPSTAAKLLNNTFRQLAVPTGLAEDINALRRKFSRRTQHHAPQWTHTLYREFNALVRYSVLLQMRASLPDVPLLLVAQAGSIPANDCLMLPDTSTAPEWHAVRGKTFYAIIAALPDRQIWKLNYQLSNLVSANNMHPANVRINIHSLVYSFVNGKWRCRQELVNAPDRLGSGMQLYVLSIELPPDMRMGIYSGSLKLTYRVPGGTAQLKYKLHVTAQDKKL